eukprot:8139909-Pyramimonas_sp.AAC.1
MGQGPVGLSPSKSPGPPMPGDCSSALGTAGMTHPSRPKPYCGDERTSVPVSTQCPLLMAHRRTSLWSRK